jgi:mono/diheme cytochrome c family protein
MIGNPMNNHPLILGVFLFVAGAAYADGEKASPGAKPFEDQVQPLLKQYCFGCHGGGKEKPKGDFRIDGLSPLPSDEVGRERWALVLKRIGDGEMPPKDKPRPTEREIEQLVQWIGGKLEAANAARLAQGRAVARRLNRVEYENTVRDLLSVQVELKDLLPEDAKSGGFDNVGEALHTSSFLLEKYLEAADRALNLAIANLPQPPLFKKRFDCREERHVKTTEERVFRRLDDGLVMFSSSQWQAITLWQLYPPDRGRYRVRLSVSGYQSAGKPVVFRVESGPMLMGTTSRLVGYFDAPADKATVIEFVEHLESRSTLRILPYGLATAQAVNKIGADKYDGPGLRVDWIDVEGPLHDAWPPASHTRLFGELPRVPAPAYNQANRVEVASKDAETDARRIIAAFARRAFRRPVTDADLKPYLDLANSKLAQKRSFEQSVRVALVAIMVAPDFLFLREKPGRLEDFALAARLSYFLWSTMPDDELLALAEQNKLGRPEELRKQVERMLSDPRAPAFTENFVGQWLDLRSIDFTEPSHLYPEFDHMLKVSMVRETELFFAEVLRNDLSVTQFVSSDFSMLNGRLAKHYGIGGVEGWEFRKVKLPHGSHRGGVITMASTLKVTANGTSTSPVMRGAWVLERILGMPSPKPPPDIPALEPDIRGATTIRQQLAKHRQIESCAACHAKIDPPGFALESFDVIGGWRENYRTSGRGEEVTIDGRRMPYLKGPKVDPADVLPDGRRFRDVDEFKQLLLGDKDQLARALTQKLVTYATGAAPQASDGPRIEAIVRAIHEKDYGLRSLIHEIVQSDLFRSK